VQLLTATGLLPWSIISLQTQQPRMTPQCSRPRSPVQKCSLRAASKMKRVHPTRNPGLATTHTCMHVMHPTKPTRTRRRPAGGARPGTTQDEGLGRVGSSRDPQPTTDASRCEHKDAHDASGSQPNAPARSAAPRQRMALEQAGAGAARPVHASQHRPPAPASQPRGRLAAAIAPRATRSLSPPSAACLACGVGWVGASYRRSAPALLGHCRAHGVDLDARLAPVDGGLDQLHAAPAAAGTAQHSLSTAAPDKITGTRRRLQPRPAGSQGTTTAAPHDSSPPHQWLGPQPAAARSRNTPPAAPGCHCHVLSAALTCPCTGRQTPAGSRSCCHPAGGAPGPGPAAPAPHAQSALLCTQQHKRQAARRRAATMHHSRLAPAGRPAAQLLG